METKQVAYLSSHEAAEKLGCSVKTVTRAARRAGVGVYVHGGGRLAALHPADLAKMRSHIYGEAGNPVWIATRGKGPHSKARKRPA